MEMTSCDAAMTTTTRDFFFLIFFLNFLSEVAVVTASIPFIYFIFRLEGGGWQPLLPL